MVYIKVFLSFLKIGIISFGGGWASVSIMRHELVTHQGIITAEQFNQVMYTIGFTPGPVAISSSAILGKEIAGYTGALLAVFGIIIPPIIVGITLYTLMTKYGDNTTIKGFTRGIGPAVVAVVFYVLFGIAKGAFQDFNFYLLLIGIGAIIALFLGVHPVFVLLGGGISGILFKLGG
ncbi:MAG: chromate transporter [Caldisericia bacterium]